MRYSYRTHSIMLIFWLELLLQFIVSARITARPALSSSAPKTLANLPPMKTYDSIVCDMDGVLWLGTKEIPKSIDALNELRLKHGKTIVFLTNNSAKSREDYSKKLKTLGYDADPDDIVTSSSILAQHLRETFRDLLAGSRRVTTTVFVVGSANLENEIRTAGFKVLSIPQDAPASLSETEFLQLCSQSAAGASKAETENVRAVVIGYDTGFSYRKMAIASMYLQQAGCKFFATNPDVANRLSNGFLFPECGSLLSALEAASGVKATVCGKPSQIAIDQIAKKMHCDPSRILMVGDRLDTDIAFANKAGFSSCLVLTGCTSADDVNQGNLLGQEYVVNADAESNEVLSAEETLKRPQYVAADIWEMATSCER